MSVPPDSMLNPQTEVDEGLAGLTAPVEDLEPTKSELIEDQELGSDVNPASDGSVAFGLEKFADELAQLVRDVPTRTNIAVFAPWGSGKSSLSNLLRARLSVPSASDDRNYRYGRYDAFKFAEDSLSRHFISQVAEELAVGTKEERRKYRQRLYVDEQTKDFSADPDTKRRVIRTALGFGAAIIAVGVTFALIAAALSVETKGDKLGEVASALLIGWAPTVAILTALTTVALFKYGVTTDIGRPTGKEQFLDKFDELLSDIDESETIVIFIDELDRCSSKQVVATLETLKTFLDSERCIFVVAADRKVIEQAVSEEARQRTPLNREDPYFSAAASYIDKIFQHQVSFPPIKPNSLSVFASGLVKNRKGIWHTLGAQRRDDVVSVVLPTHVINPRRAKVLLNGFVVDFRIAKHSWKREMNSTPEDRVVEIAKLSTLKSEFPFFYDDLVRFDDLIDAVLELDADPEAEIQNEELERVARRYAETGSSAASLIAKEDAASTVTRAEVEEELRQQLLQYLHKTAQVTNPGSDLIYLEAVGSGFKIPDEIAFVLEKSARNNAPASDVVASLSVVEQNEALRFLASLMSNSRRLVGLEKKNAMAYALAFAEAMESISTETANSVTKKFAENEAAFRELMAPADEGDEVIFTSEVAAGAMRITARTARVEAPVLLAASLTDTAHAPSAIRRAVPLWGVLSPSARTKCASSIAHQAGYQAEKGEADPLSAVRPEISALSSEDQREILRQICRRIEEIEPVEKSAEPEASKREAESLREKTVTAAIKFSLDSSRPEMGIRIAEFSLRRQRPFAIKAVRGELSGLSPVSDRGLVEAIVDVAHADAPDEWFRWLDAIASGSFDDSQLLLGLDAFMLAVYHDAVYSPDEVTDPVLENLLPIAKQLAPPRERLLGLQREIGNSFQARPLDDSRLAEKNRAIEVARAFGDEGLVGPTWLSNQALSSVADWYDEDTPEGSEAIVHLASERFIESFGTGADPEHASALADAMMSCTWNERSEAAFQSLLCSRSQVEGGGERVDSISLEIAAGVVAGRGSRAGGVASMWIDLVEPDPRSIWLLLEQVADDPLEPPVADAVGRAVRRYDSAAKQYELVESAIASLSNAEVDSSYFQAAGISTADKGRVPGAIVQLAARADSADSFRDAIRLWALSKPQTEAGSRKLIDGVLTPLTDRGEDGFNLIIAEFACFADLPERYRDSVSSQLLLKAPPSLGDSLRTTILGAGWSDGSA